ncbi:cysteine hydrolase [Nocardia sp. JMUB6875]|uniref:cysteine hydrolase family protein n=1 Tax=Nocardia sp. JMUB6875 TaxID=3158170 RepID=UPI0032E55C94
MTKTALLSLDMINELLHPDGKFAAFGYPQEARRRGTIDRAATALARARAQGIPVMHVAIGFSPDYAEGTTVSPLLGQAPQYGSLQLGTWATEFLDEVAPESGEPVIVKHRVSAFYNTDLELRLRALGIERVLLMGCSTDLVVQATAREAHDRDFIVEILADATSSESPELHESGLAVLRHITTVTTVDEALPAV